MPFFENVIETVIKGQYMEYPVINIYFNHLMMLKKGDWRYYHLLKELKEKHFKLLNINQLKNIYVGLINFAVGKNEMNDTDGINISSELFNFYSEILRKKPV